MILSPKTITFLVIPFFALRDIATSAYDLLPGTVFSFLKSTVICCNTIQDKVFKNGPSKVCGSQPLKDLKGYPFKFFKGCLPQILFGPFLNALSHISIRNMFRIRINISLNVEGSSF